MIAPLQCVSCNAPLPVVDSSSAACAFCGASNPIPQQYRDELRLTRELDQATRKAVREWSRLNQISFPRWWFVCTAFAPFILISSGLAAVLVVGLVRAASRSTLPMMSGVGIWLPLIPLQAVAAIVGIRMILVSGTATVGAAFAAAPPLAPGGSPSCRLCGAPLTVNEGDILVRCIYCKAESIICLDQSSMRDLQERLGSARSSLAQAMAALAAKARIITIQICGRALITVAFVILPLIWSFSAEMQASYWSTLITFDVWVLALCLFWYVREVLLPPATIEELEALIDGPGDSRTEQHPTKAATAAAGTRGWYDHASEKQNFVIPAIVALMFLAIELLVFKG
ncbi:MAG TPA: hypothetical protein VGP81_06825 [Pyrinomonadaceae bacterium]|nr:hypothetical protein [Pyrinomonadaceae bacterium]